MMDLMVSQIMIGTRSKTFEELMGPLVKDSSNNDEGVR